MSPTDYLIQSADVSKCPDVLGTIVWSPPPMSKRIVIIHACGLWQIVGMSPPPYPAYFEFSSGGGITTRPSSLVSIKPRYALYREIVAPPSGRFNEYHPEQQ